MTKKMLARKGSKRFRMQLDMTLPAKREAVDPAVQADYGGSAEDQPRSGKEDDIELALSKRWPMRSFMAASVIQTKASSAVLCVTISVDC